MNNKRKGNTKNNEFLLFAEVDGFCPLCPKNLIFDKKGQKNRNFEIAHIYPLNPTKEELLILKDLVKLNDDPNHSDNLICLCNECHNKFDNPRTLDEYNNLVQIKKEIINSTKEKSLWFNTTIETEIEEIIDFLSDEDLSFDTDILSYDPKTIEEKTNSSITFTKKRKIHRNVEDYFFHIKNKFIEIEKLKPNTTDLISIQIKTHYLKLKKLDQTKNQKEIFDAMVSWLNKLTKQKSNESTEIIISYFIQNCEIFE